GRLDFDAAIEMHDALTVLVIAERFDRQGKQEWFLFSKHRSDLPFGCAVDARVCPPFFPVVEISLGLFQAFEAQAFEWCSLGMTNTCLDFPFSVWILNPARHGDRAVVGEHVAVERIECGIVNVSDEHAFAQIVEHDDASATAQPTKSLLMQFGPDTGAGTERQ